MPEVISTILGKDVINLNYKKNTFTSQCLFHTVPVGMIAGMPFSSLFHFVFIKDSSALCIMKSKPT